MNRGIKASEAGTSMNSILINLMGVAGQSSEAMDQLGLSAYDSEGKFKGVTNVLRELKTRLNECTDEQKNQFQAMIGGKTQIDTLNALLAGLDEEYGSLHDSLVNSNGALEEMYQTMSNTTAGKIEEFKGKLESLGIQLADKLLPHITKLLDKGMELIEWFGNLDEGTQEAIMKFGFFAATGGVVFKVLGKLTTGIGSVVTAGGKLLKWLGSSTTALSSASSTLGTLGAGASGAAGNLGNLGGVLGSTMSTGTALKTAMLTLGKTFGPVAIAGAAVGAAVYATHESMEYMNSSMITASDDLSLLQKAFNKMDGTLLKSKKEMEELGWVYKDWSGKVSKDYAKSLEESATKMSDLNFEVQRLANSNIEITADTRDSLVSQTTEMCNSIIDEINKHSSETAESLRNLFSNNGQKDWYEDTVVNAISRGNEESIQKIREKEAQITEIYNNAFNQHREIAESEKVAIEELYSQIGDIKAQALAEDSDDYEEAIANFQVRARKKNAEGISEMLQDEKKSLSDKRAAIEESYDTQIEMIAMKMNNMNTTERIAAQQSIDALKAEKQDKLNAENEYYNSLLEVVRNEYPELAEIIDEETGKINSVKQQKYTEDYNNYLANIQGLDSVTKTGFQSMATTMADGTTAVNDYYFKVDEVTGNVVGCWNKTTGEVQGKNAQIVAELEKQKSKYAELDDTARNEINSIINSNKNMTSEQKATARSIVADMKSIEVGAGGVRTGIINCNGTPVKVVVEKDGTIRDMNAIKNAMDNIPRTIYTTVQVQYKDANGGTFTGSKYYSDGRGGYINPGYATGTKHAKKGWATVAEEGAELIVDGKKSMLVGLNGMKLYNFKGGETVFNAAETRKMMLDDMIVGGGYFSPSSSQSQQLVTNTTNNYSTINNSSQNFDVTAMSYAIANAVQEAMKNLSIYMNTEKVASIIDKSNGRKTKLNERVGY